MSARRAASALVTGESFAALVAQTDAGLARALARATSATAVEAILPEGAEALVVRWVGPVLHVRASGSAFSIVVRRSDGSALTLDAPPAPGVTELTEAHCVGFDLLEGGAVRFESSAAALDDTTLVSRRPRAAVALLELVTGERLGVQHELLVGRSPRVRRAPAGGMPRLLAVEHANVSRTHARVSVTEGGVTLEDLGSANGTRIAAADGSERAVVAGEPVALLAGMVVSLADRLAFRVVRVP